MMLRFVKNNLLAKPLRNALVVVSCIVSILLMLVMVNIGQQINDQFSLSTQRYSYVLGGNCADTELVLDGLFFYDMPTKRLPIEDWETVGNIEGVTAAVPIAMADYVTGTPYRMIGTDRTFFVHNGDLVYPLAAGRALGQYTDTPNAAEVVLGSTVAKKCGLDLGGTFTASHSEGAGGEHANFVYTVVGILAPTGTAIDNAAYTHYQAVWQAHGVGHHHEDEADEDEEHDEHDEHEDEGEEHENHAETGFIHLVLLSTTIDGMNNLMAAYDHSEDLTLASTAGTIHDIYTLFGDAGQLMVGVVVIVIVMAFNMLFLAMFTAAGERRREVAVLRALGSSRGKILATMLLESVVILTLACLVGWLLSFAGLAIVGGLFTGMMGIVVSPTVLCIQELYIILGSYAVGLTATVIPALMVYNTEPTRYLR